MSKISLYPSGTPTADDKVLFTDVSNGNATLNTTVSELLAGGISTGADSVIIDVIYDSDVDKGTPLYVTGYNQGQGATTVDIADADVSTSMPVIGLADANYSANDKGTAIIMGDLGGLNTNLFNVNDVLYVASGGGLTDQRPQNPEALIQNVGIVTRQNVSNGSLKVSALGRSNAVPNLQANNIFWSYINGTGGVDQQVINSAYLPRPVVQFSMPNFLPYTISPSGGVGYGANQYCLLVNDTLPTLSTEVQTYTRMSLINANTDEARVLLTRPGLYKINLSIHTTDIGTGGSQIEGRLALFNSPTGKTVIRYIVKMQDSFRDSFGDSQLFNSEAIFEVSISDATAGNFYVAPLIKAIGADFDLNTEATFDGVSSSCLPKYSIEYLGWNLVNTDMTAGGTIDPTQ